VSPNLQGLAARLDRLEQRLDRIAANAVDFTTLARTNASGVVNKDGDLTIDAAGQIKLAGGGAGIARNGDSMLVTIPPGTVAR
jgi:hypothetical protein